MTEVAFHFGAPDKLGYAGRLLRKATAAGARLWVLGEDAQIQALDSSLWSLSATSFLAHCKQDAASGVQKRSNVVLVSDLTDNPEGFQVLVNLSTEMPHGFDRFDRVIEVVSTDDEDRQHARLRWKRYTGLGYSIQRHDLNLRPSA